MLNEQGVESATGLVVPNAYSTFYQVSTELSYFPPDFHASTMAARVDVLHETKTEWYKRCGL